MTSGSTKSRPLFTQLLLTLIACILFVYYFCYLLFAHLFIIFVCLVLFCFVSGFF